MSSAFSMVLVALSIWIMPTFISAVALALVPVDWMGSSGQGLTSSPICATPGLIWV